MKYLPTGSVGISWRVDEHTHRGISFNVVVSSVLLLVAFVFVLVEAERRFRASELSR